MEKVKFHRYNVASNTQFVDFEIDLDKENKIEYIHISNVELPNSYMMSSIFVDIAFDLSQKFKGMSVDDAFFKKLEKEFSDLYSYRKNKFWKKYIIS